jgi:hypothetical protein
MFEARTKRIASVIVVALTSMTERGSAQDNLAPALIGPFTDSPKFHAPFSADATTVVDHAGTRQEMRARYFRDSAGRVRVEYADGAGHLIAMIMPNPYARRDRLYMVDDAQRTVALVTYGIYADIFNAASKFGIATGALRFDVYGTSDVHQGGNGTLDSLGEGMIEGLKVAGIRFTAAPSGASDERWESPDLAVTVAGQHLDPGKNLNHYLSAAQYSPRGTTVWTVCDACGLRTDDANWISRSFPAERRGKKVVHRQGRRFLCALCDTAGRLGP